MGRLGSLLSFDLNCDCFNCFYTFSTSTHVWLVVVVVSRKGGVPQHMQGHAIRSLPSAAFPGGQPICFPYHAPGASQCAAGNACWMAHTCPVFLPAGGICNQNHRLQDHQ